MQHTYYPDRSCWSHCRHKRRPALKMAAVLSAWIHWIFFSFPFSILMNKGGPGARRPKPGPRGKRYTWLFLVERNHEPSLWSFQLINQIDIILELNFRIPGHLLSSRKNKSSYFYKWLGMVKLRCFFKQWLSEMTTSGNLNSGDFSCASPPPSPLPWMPTIIIRESWHIWTFPDIFLY